MVEHLLSSEWTLYLHYKDLGRTYNENLEKLQDISTIENFWRTLNNIPKTYELFSNGNGIKKIKRTNSTPCAYSFFRKGISPCWEDPNNIKGFELTLKSGRDLVAFDENWKNTLINLISDDKYYFITGVRAVDLTKGNSVLYRLEYWFCSEEVKDFSEDILIKDFNVNSKLTYRSHSNMKET